MAQMPIEVLIAGDIPADDLDRAISTANTIQYEVKYTLLTDGVFVDFAAHSYTHARAKELLSRIGELRSRALGYHPYLIGFVDAELDGEDCDNIFGSDEATKGLSVFTIAKVPEVILPRNKLSAYFLYYLAKSAFSFLAPDFKNHDDTRRCPFDRKLYKPDIVESMRARAVCDNCRRWLLSRVSPAQFQSIEKMFSACGDLLIDGPNRPAIDPRPRVFIGSSVEGLPIARALQRILEDEMRTEVWDQGTVFGLGDSTLEALERAVLSYDFGVFVFTPDDELVVRGYKKTVARDNVVFELGLFVGKHTRRRAFALCPAGASLALPSDLAGITTARYAATEADLVRALAPACESLRRAVRTVLSPTTAA
jgi:hypothetical protein